MDSKKVTLAEWLPTDRQIELVNQVLKSGRLTYGSFHKQLEEEFAKKHNFKYCIFTNSGTSALEVAWAYLKRRHNWKDGAEVIVPATTFVATVNTILHNKLKPVLVDINFYNLNIETELIEEKINKNTVAVCPVDLLGRPVDIEPIVKLARKYKLKIVEDSCETMFVKHPNTKPVGSCANIAVYSSYLAHIISTGVGGFLCTNDFYTEKEIRSMIWHGRDNYYLSIDDNEKNKKKLIQTRFKFNLLGYSYRLTEMEAALGVDEIDRSKQIIEQRVKNANYFYNLIKDLEGYFQLPDLVFENAWMFFPIICKGSISRDKLMLHLEKNGIQTRAIMPLINQPVYKDMFDPKDYPVADYVNNHGILLGIHHFLTFEDLEYMAEVLKEYFK